MKPSILYGPKLAEFELSQLFAHGSLAVVCFLTSVESMTAARYQASAPRVRADASVTCTTMV